MDNQPKEQQPLELLTTPAMPLAEELGRLEGTVLVIEDVAPNRVILRKLLGTHGLDVIEAESGEAGLIAAFEHRPDIVLLDVMLPGINGFEVCERLKTTPATESTPVILLTQLREREFRIRGIKAGANDFINKPIDPEDVLFRLRNALRDRRMYKLLEQNLTRVRELEELKERLTQMMVHDLRSPLTSIMGMLDLFGLSEDLDDGQREMLASARGQGARITEMISSLLDIGRLEEHALPLHLEDSDLRTIATEACEQVRGIVYRATLTCENPETPVPCRCDRGLIGRVMVNLLSNALKVVAGGGTATLRTGINDDHVWCEVEDDGPGIPAEMHTRIFEKFGQVEDGFDKRYTSGLGLTFCRLAVEEHGGTIRVSSEPGQGSLFRFELPRDGSA